MANLPWKNISIITAVITAILATLNYTYNAGRTSMRVEIQAEHNTLIQNAQDKHKKELEKALEEFGKDLKLSQEKSAEYYEALLAKQESDLITKHENQIKIASITHEATNVTDTISPDSLQLFKQATSIITRPRNYGYRDAGNN